MSHLCWVDQLSCLLTSVPKTEFYAFSSEGQARVSPPISAAGRLLAEANEGPFKSLGEDLHIVIHRVPESLESLRTLYSYGPDTP